MAFQTLISSPLALANQLDLSKLLFGTVQLGTTWGMIKSASIQRTGQLDELLDNRGNLRAALLRNPQTTLNMTVTWEKSQPGPTLGSQVTIPFMGIQGMVVDMTAQWEEAGFRSLQMTVRGWDTLAGAVVGEFDQSSGDFDDSN